MTVILVHDAACGHGVLCVATTFNAAINFLIEHDWLDASIDVRDANNYPHDIVEVFGSSWAEQVKKLSLFQFNEMFTDWFNMEVCEVITEGE